MLEKIYINELKAVEPVICIQPDEQYKFEAVNAFGKKFETEAEFTKFMASPEKKTMGHPYYGPIELVNYDGKSSLKITIDKIDITKVYSCLSKSTGLLKNDYKNRNCKLFKVENESIQFSDNLIIKGAYSIGCATTLDRRLRKPGRCSKLGGNIDIPLLAEGSSIYLPVNHSRCLFAMGDAHFYQGQGELSGIAFEADANITITAQFVEAVESPIIEDHNNMAFIGYGPTLNKAYKNALTHAIKFIQLQDSLKNLTKDDLYQLLGGVANVINGNITGKIKTCAVVVKKAHF